MLKLSRPAKWTHKQHINGDSELVFDEMFFELGILDSFYRKNKMWLTICFERIHKPEENEMLGYLM